MNIIANLKFKADKNPLNIVDGDIILVVCKLSDDGLYLYQNLKTSHERFQIYGVDTISILKYIKGQNSIKTEGRVTVFLVC